MGDVIDDTLAILRDCGMDDPAVREFLEVVVRSYQPAEDDEDDPPFEAFRRLLYHDDIEYFRPAVEPFLNYARDNGGIEVVRRLHHEGVDVLIRWYGDVPIMEEPAEDGAGDGAEDYGDADPEELWSAAVAAYGPAWADWDGRDSGWEEYRDWFVEAAATDHPAAGRVAADRLGRLDGLDVAGRIAALSEAGFPVAADEDTAWDGLVAEHGGDWAAWDGSVSQWEEYRDWFYGVAESDGPGTYALVVGRLSPLDVLSIGDRITRLREYGLDLGVTADPDTVWNALVADHGEGWTSWDGREASWEDYRDWFYEVAQTDGDDTRAVVASRLDRLDDVDPAERLAVLRDYGLAVAGAYSEDELDSWYPFLQEEAARWNGEDASWPRFRRGFLEAAQSHTPDLTDPATAFLDYAELEPDRLAYFAEYGIQIGPDAEEEQGEQDFSAWYEFLAGYHPRWLGEDQWDTFRADFLAAARESGVEDTATGFLEYADGEDDKIAFLARSGVVVEAGTGGEAGLEITETARETAARAVLDSAYVPDRYAPVFGDAFAKLAAKYPQVAGFTPEQVQQLIKEIAGENLGGGASTPSQAGRQQGDEAS